MGWTNEQIMAATAGQTVGTLFRDVVSHHGDQVAFRRPVGDGWQEMTYAEYGEAATRIATALSGLGVGRGDRVALMMRNRPEFHVADIACVLVGATPISIYNSSSPDQIAYLMGHSGVVAAVVEDGGYLDRLLAVRSELPALREVVVIEAPATGPTDGVHAWADLLRSEPGDLATLSAIAQPSDLATVIYTSGTTGPPKGVMLDHANVTWTVTCMREVFGDTEVAGSRLVSYLPMAHIAERNVSHYGAIGVPLRGDDVPGAGAGRDVPPAGAPARVLRGPARWEKIHAGVMAMASADPARKAQLDAALDIGLKVSDHVARAEDLPADLAVAWAEADTGLGAVRALLGLDACIAAISGAAPIAVEIFDFFRGLGVPLSEVYGMSETTGLMTWDPFEIRVGTVGRAVPGARGGAGRRR